MRTRQAIALGLAFVASGCGDPLQVKPGSDFALELSSNATEVSSNVTALRQRLEPVDLQFKLGGCEQATFSLEVGNGVGDRKHALEPQRQDDGSFRVSVPVAWLTGDSLSCGVDERGPTSVSLELVADCVDGRVARSNRLVMSYATSWRTSWLAPYGNSQAVFRGTEPGTLFSIGSGWLTEHAFAADDASSAIAAAYAAVSPQVAPLFARSGNRLYAWGGCPFEGGNGCGFSDRIEINPGLLFQTSATYVHPYDIDSEGRINGSDPLKVPGEVGDLQFESAETAVLITSHMVPTLLTRIVNGAAPVSQALADERLPTRFTRLSDGSLVFVTHDVENQTLARLRKSDGTLVVQFDLPGSGTVNMISISPHSEATLDPLLALVRGGQFWLGSPRGQWNRVSTELLGGVDLDSRVFTNGVEAWGTVWLDDAVVLWTGKAVEAFELAAPHARRYFHAPAALVPGGEAPTLTSVAAVGRNLALVTWHGVRLLDAAGELQGGAEPLPCVRDTNRLRAVAMDDHTVAFPAGDFIYLFDFGRYTQTDQ